MILSWNRSYMHLILLGSLLGSSSDYFSLHMIYNLNKISTLIIIQSKNSLQVQVLNIADTTFKKHYFINQSIMQY